MNYLFERWCNSCKKPKPRHSFRRLPGSGIECCEDCYDLLRAKMRRT